MDFHRGVSLEQRSWAFFAEQAQNLQVIIEIPFRVQAAHNVEFMHIAGVLFDPFNILQAQLEPVLFSRACAEGAEAAAVHAVISGVDVAVDVEEHLPVGLALFHLVGQSAQPDQVFLLKQKERLLLVEPLRALHHFFDLFLHGIFWN